MTTTSASLSNQLARRVDELRWSDVPEQVRAVAKAHALDAVGIALASTAMDYGEVVHLAGTRLGTSDECRVLGFGTPMPAAITALVDGTLIHGLDFDDTHIGAIYHATAPALAAALAVGEAVHADGETVMLAYVIGMEVGCRLAAAGAGMFHAQGFHPTGIAGTFAAACVTAKIRSLAPETLTSALGLCGSQAAGILELHESWLKRMHPGWAAHSGIVAATMAEAGFRGPATVFEGPAGIFKSHINVIPSAETLGVGDLGSRWMTADIALKPYPCCHFTHAFVDAALGVLADLGREAITAEEVERIVCPTSAAIIPMVTTPVAVKTAPATIYDALFSVQFVVGNALTGRPVSLPTFYDKPLDDPIVLAMAKLVTCPPESDTNFPAEFPGEVELHLTDGTVVRRRVTSSLGTPGNPMSDDETQAKFSLLARRVVPDGQASRIADLVSGLDQVADVAELIDACVR